MGRYDFVSPGAAAGNAIQQFLVQRAMQERQQMLDQQAQQEQEAARREQEATIRQRDEQIALQREQEARIAAAQQRTQADLEEERGFRRATTIAQNALPDDPADAATADLLTKHGYGGQLRKVPGVISQGAQTGVTEDDIPLYDVNETPESFAMRGGSAYLSQRAAADERSALAEQNSAAADERAGADRQLRLLIAQVGASGAAGSRQLADELKRLQIDQLQGKVDDENKTADLARRNAQRSGQDTVDLLKQLADFGEDGTVTLKPGTANLYGARIPLAGFVPGSDTADASAAMNRLRSRVIVDLLREMKEQSRTGATGFGAMNEKEFGVLEGGASELGSSFISDEAAAAELKRIYDIAVRATQGGGDPVRDAPAPVGGDGWVVVNGARVRKKPR